jgi:hypothetical protein
VFCSGLLLFEVDLLVRVLRNSSADLGGSLAGLGHGVGVERLLRACGALGAVVALVAAAQARVAKRPVAAAIARKLVYNAADLCGLLVDVHLPGVLEVLAGELCA